MCPLSVQIFCEIAAFFVAEKNCRETYLVAE
jgi:hypothetical protein